MTTPSPDLSILETRVYRGANVWSYDKAIHLVVDLGSLEDFPTNTLAGFTDNLLQLLPGLREHSCSRGRRGGFVERLNEGTWLGSRRRARRTGAAAGGRPRHPPRQDPVGEGPQGPLQHRLRLRRRERRHRGGPARRTPGQPPGPGRPGVRLGQGAGDLHPARRAYGVRPLDPGHPRRGRLAGHPVDPAQPALAGAARPGRAPEAHPGHDDLGHQRHRGRRGLRQGPDHPAARRRRASRCPSRSRCAPPTRPRPSRSGSASRSW